jgi:fructose-bisphosphate aldolase class II
MIVTTKQLYDDAYGRYALGAWKVNNLEQVSAVFEGNHRARSPFVLQISLGARKYAGVKMIEAIVRAAADHWPGLRFAVHLDHGDEKTCFEAVKSDFYSSVMIDASHEPFGENVEITRRVVEWAHARGMSVEAELGGLGGVEEDIALDEQHTMLTDPEEAKRFVEATGCDSLAVAVGTSRGAYKFSGSQALHLERIAAIQQRLPGFPLVLHGASSVPADEVRRINEAGGALRDGAQGVALSQLPRAVELGICQVNIDTDGRLIWTRVHREFFRDQPAGFDLRDPGAAFMAEMASFVEDRAGWLGSAGKL